MTLQEKIKKIYNSEISFRIEAIFDRGMEFMLSKGNGEWPTVYIGHSFEEGLDMRIKEITPDFYEGDD
jgi:hypothetical protein